jgi:hypothetical protein
MRHWRRLSQAKVNDHAAEFHPVPRGQAGHVECDAGVLNAPDLHDRATSAVFENAIEGFPITGVWRAGNRAAGYPIAFVSFHHRALPFNRFDALRGIVPRIIHER